MGIGLTRTHPLRWIRCGALGIGVLSVLALFLKSGSTIFGGAPGRLFSLFPLLLIPLFHLRDSRREFPEALMLFAMAVSLLGVIFFRMSLVWAGSFWMALLLAEQMGYGLSRLTPLLILCVPPVSDLPAIALGFELRMMLSHLAGAVLSSVDPETQVHGNLIVFRGLSYAVDPACEGLKMGGVSVLLALAVLARTARTGRVLIVLGLPLLWLCANLFRILVLVVFRIPAGGARHEIIGIALFAAMLVFPLLLTGLLFPGHALLRTAHVRPPPRFVVQILVALLPLGVLLTLYLGPEQPKLRSPWPEHILAFRLDPSSTRSDPRIAVYHSGEQTLILKRSLFALGTAHDPRICFEALGFAVTERPPRMVGGQPVRVAHLTRDRAYVLYWWHRYPGGHAASELDWRSARLRGADVTQWNLYGADEAAVSKSASELVGTDFASASTTSHPLARNRWNIRLLLLFSQPLTSP